MFRTIENNFLTIVIITSPCLTITKITYPTRFQGNRRIYLTRNDLPLRCFITCRRDRALIDRLRIPLGFRRDLQMRDHNLNGIRLGFKRHFRSKNKSEIKDINFYRSKLGYQRLDICVEFFVVLKENYRILR